MQPRVLRLGAHPTANTAVGIFPAPSPQDASSRGRRGSPPFSKPSVARRSTLVRYTASLTNHRFFGSAVKNSSVLVLCLICPLLLTISLPAQDQPSPAPSSSPDQKLTIEAIFDDGGVTGRPPEGMKWSPDGTKLSYVQRDHSGDHGALYYIDLAT